MKCNPIRWLWGLIPLAALGGMMFLGGVPGKIQDDLRIRAEGALSAGGFGWASTAFSGRDAVIQGDAADESDQKRVGGVVRSTWGVRVVDDQTKLLEEQKNFLCADLRLLKKLAVKSSALPGPRSLVAKFAMV
jgi:OmpA-OmpF porin, OOP family